MHLHDNDNELLTTISQYKHGILIFIRYVKNESHIMFRMMATCSSFFLYHLYLYLHVIPQYFNMLPTSKYQFMDSHQKAKYKVDYVK